MKTSSSLSLRDLQLWMRWIITDPRGVEEALHQPPQGTEKHLSRYLEPQPSARKCIAEQKPLSLVSRLSIYAEAYFLRLVDAMQADFSRLFLILGEHRFQKLVADYLKAYPSQNSNIGEVGRHLSSFIQDYPETVDTPFLAALADLEWQSIEVFYADDFEEFDPRELSRLQEDEWSQLKLFMNPSSRILSSLWPLDIFWRLEEESDPLSLAKNPQEKNFLLWRQKGLVNFQMIPAQEAFAFKCFQEGKNLSETLEEVTEHFAREDADALSASVMSFFSRWITDGLISGIKTNLHERENK